MGLQAGDSIIAVQYAKVYRQLYWPQATDTMFVEVIRNGTPVMLGGRPIYYARNKYTTIAEGKLTEEQATFKKWYWRKRKGTRQ